MEQFLIVWELQTVRNFEAVRDKYNIRWNLVGTGGNYTQKGVPKWYNYQLEPLLASPYFIETFQRI